MLVIMTIIVSLFNW